MSANSLGYLFKITSFGESHGPALGVVIEGCPSGLEVNEERLHQWLQRRRPGSSQMVSGRKERDLPEILSGVFDGRTLGTPIAVIVHNEGARSEDYSLIKDKHRVGHADDVWQDKFGYRDHRGGGRASGRETLARVIAGAFAQMLVEELSPTTRVQGFVKQVADLVFTPDEDFKERLEPFLLKAKEEGESYGAIVQLSIFSPPRGLGQPVFSKLKSDLARSMMSLGATVGFEIGGGFSSCELRGSELHREMDAPEYGGIRGGISTGETISLKVAFKPTSSIGDVAKRGRHDPCIALRALPVMEAMAYIVLADHILWNRLDSL